MFEAPDTKDGEWVGLVSAEVMEKKVRVHGLKMLMRRERTMR
jgi:hypothetical protein